MSTRKPQTKTMKAERAPSLAVADAEEDFSLRIIRIMAELPMAMLSGDGTGRELSADDRINAALAAVGELLVVSRVYVMLDEEGGRFLRKTHEWVNRTGPSVSSWPLHDYKKDIPSLKPLLEGKPYLAADTRNMPADMRFALSKQGVDSMLLVPLIEDGVWIGLIGFNNCGAERAWRETEISMLRHLAGLVVAALGLKKLHAARDCLERIRVTLAECDIAPGLPPPPSGAEDAPTLLEAERLLILNTLARHRGNRGAAAKQLGIAWAALDRRCKKLGIDVRRM